MAYPEVLTLTTSLPVSSISQLQDIQFPNNVTDGMILEFSLAANSYVIQLPNTVNWQYPVSVSVNTAAFSPTHILQIKGSDGLIYNVPASNTSW